MVSKNAEFVRGEVDGFSNVDGLPTQDRTIIPRFFSHPVRVLAKNGEEETYEFKEVEMVEILVAGDTKSAPIEKVTERHRNMYRSHYNAWKEGKEIAATGTPIDIWPVLIDRPALLKTLKHNNIYTVEAFSEIPDSSLNNLGPGARNLRDLAVTYLEAKSKSEPSEKLMKDNEILHRKIELLQKQLLELQNTSEKKLNRTKSK